MTPSGGHRQRHNEAGTTVDRGRVDLAAEPQRASRTQQATPAHAGLVDHSLSGARDRVAQEAPAGGACGWRGWPGAGGPAQVTKYIREGPHALHIYGLCVGP